MEINSLFVYGTLCDPETQRKIIGRTLKGIPARLEGYERREGKWPYIVPKKGGDVQGLLLCALNETDMVRLDAYEGVEPRWDAGQLRRFYIREPVTVAAREKKNHLCWVYMPHLADWPEHWR